jgi:pimeloyl-ACP methyl ester carboxylesterase
MTPTLKQKAVEEASGTGPIEDARARLLSTIPLAERTLDLAGVQTAVLEGGDGPPVVLLHGPGECAAKWICVFPPAELERIAVPTALIWGRHDLAAPLSVAEAASKRYGWPLCVIEDAADDPPIEQPKAFLAALGAVFERS